MPPIDLDAIRARLAAATPGPWTAAPNGHLGGSTVLYEQNGKRWPLPGCFHCGENDAIYELGDADLIAHAPTDLAALVAEVERLRAVAEAVTAFRRHTASLSTTNTDAAAAAWDATTAALDAWRAGGGA